MQSNSKTLQGVALLRRAAASITGLVRSPTTLEQLVQKGDDANRRRSWREAEAAYSAALAIDPSLKHIWVQCGHALKERGFLEPAEAAYRCSLKLDDTLADTHLQLAHLLKLQGRLEEANAAYQHAYHLDPAAGEQASPRDRAMREVFDFIVSAAQPEIICDIGSFDGHETLRLSGLAPHARVFAFEANNTEVTL